MFDLTPTGNRPVTKKLNKKLEINRRKQLKLGRLSLLFFRITRC